jgi:hypothetical protein
LFILSFFFSFFLFFLSSQSHQPMADQEEEAATHGKGPLYLTKSPITRQMFVQLLDKLELAFGKGFRFTIDPYPQGGIVFSEWPGKEKGQVKLINLGRLNSKNSKWDTTPWPIIEDGWRDHWFTSDEVLMKASARRTRPIHEWKHTFLKALNGAPAWTSEEVRKFEAVFLSFDIVLSYGHSCVQPS